MVADGKQTEFLFAHLEDLADDAEKGILRASEFYSPAELVLVRRWITSRGKRECARVWGGYGAADRARVYFLPDYMTAEQDGTSLPELLRSYGHDDPTAVLKISGSGFRVLSHRDYMGSVLSLGIERDVTGDIVVHGDSEAYLFCDRAIAPYITENLCKIANDAATVLEAPVPEGSFGEKQFREMRDTVASLRLDAIVASACNLSRENAKRAVTGGSCELNYEQTVSPDAEVEVGDVFSIRGYGKYTLASCGGENARGRLRIVIHKYV
jgi:RNA-binding protein YlmH